MSDQKTNTGNQDRMRVDSNDPSEVEYLHRQFSYLTHQQVLEAVKSNGPMREDKETFLKALK